MAREVVARAPTRIDLGGGWTDVPPYCDREGGFVCNVAITRYATATVRTARGTASAVAASDASLVSAALKRAKLNDVDVVLENDFPIGAGLGGSSAASAALLSALAAWRGQPWERDEIAEEGRRMEVADLGVPGGRQDHYAASYGGALALTFTSRVAVRRIRLSDEVRRRLPGRSTLIYTGQSRISGATITAVLGAYQRKDTRVVRALRRMREIAEVMADRLEAGDLDAVGGLLGEHWEHQRSLHPSIPTPRIDSIVEQARNAGAQGAKAMGASGGGCVLIMANEDNVERVRHAVAPLGDIVEFEVDSQGAAVLHRTE